MPIEITYKLDSDEYVEAQRVYLSKGRTRIYLWTFLLAGTALVATGLWISFATGDTQPWWLIAGVAIMLGPAAQAAQARNEFKKGRRLQVESSLIFSDDGLTGRSSLGEGNLKWDAISSLVESKRFILLLLAPRMFYILPKRAFAPEQLAEFRELLARKLPQKK
jgi:hypothetical protein